MTSHVGRLYAAVAAVLTFFVLWAAIAAHPWQTAKVDPRVAALAQREQLLRREAVLVRQIVARRTAAAQAARSRLAAVRPQTAASSVRVVTLPPLTVTRTS